MDTPIVPTSDPVPSGTTDRVLFASGAQSPARGGPVFPAGNPAPSPESSLLGPSIADGSLRLSVDPHTHEVIATIVDPATNEVIRQIPSEEARRIAEQLQALVGSLLDRKV